MKKRISTTLLLSALVGSLILLGSGCSKKSVIPPEATAGSGGSGGTAIQYPQAEGGYSESNLPAEGTLDDTSSLGGETDIGEPSTEYKQLHGRSTLGLNPIYYDFDQAGVRSDMVERMVNNAEYIQQISGVFVVVEGNSDERGTNEYNLALGERRAQNARRYLIDLGVAPAQIRTVSYGEEKPLFTDQDEFSYSQNRRADFVVE